MFSSLSDHGAAGALQTFHAAASSACENHARDEAQLRRYTEAVSRATEEVAALNEALAAREEEVEAISFDIARARRMVEAKHAELEQLRATSAAVTAPRLTVAEEAQLSRKRRNDILSGMLHHFTNQVGPVVLDSLEHCDPTALRQRVQDQRLQLEMSQARCVNIQSQIDDRLKRMNSRSPRHDDTSARTHVSKIDDSATSLRAQLSELRESHAAAVAERAAQISSVSAEREQLRRHLRTLSKLIETVTQEHDEASRRYRDVFDELTALSKICSSCGEPLTKAVFGALGMV